MAKKDRIFGEEFCFVLALIQRLDGVSTGDDIRDAVESLYYKCADLEDKILAMEADNAGEK